MFSILKSKFPLFLTSHPGHPLQAISFFKYLREPEVNTALQAVVGNMRAQWVLTAANTLGAPDLARKWDEYWAALVLEVPRYSRAWLTDCIVEAFKWYNRFHPADYAEKVYLLTQYLSEIDEMTL
jgi:hypothetical protein